jgi:hypothetical protein
MAANEVGILGRQSGQEKDNSRRFLDLYRQNPLPEAEVLANLGLFIKRQTLTRMLFMHDLYRRIVDIPGVVMEFGCRWGQNLALFHSFRGIYDPFNSGRAIIGFDTFEGFAEVTPEDGGSQITHQGSFAVTPDYQNYLDQVLACHEQESPLSHIKKYELCKGDAGVEVPKYLERHPETIIALAYFDMDVYKPTKTCLEAIRPYLTKGSVLGFDELNYTVFPGETQALREVLGLDRFALKRSPHGGGESYLVIE